MKKIIEFMTGSKIVATSGTIKGRKSTGVHDVGSGTKGFEKDGRHTSASYN